MEIRIAEVKDIPQISKLFNETIREVNQKDYSSEQIEAWASNANNTEMWLKAIEEQFFVVTENNSIIAGFTSLDKNACIDFMYVHKNYQQMGVATQLLVTIEKQAIKLGITEIWTDASLTAKPFFLKMGFNIEKVYVKKANDVDFENTIMTKILTQYQK
jgi:putative acetyltransferase